MARTSLNPKSVIGGEPLELDPGQDPFAPESIKHLATRYGSPLFVIDAERVRRQYRRLAAALPGVDLHYALKPLPHASVIRLKYKKTKSAKNKRSNRKSRRKKK